MKSVLFWDKKGDFNHSSAPSVPKGWVPLHVQGLKTHSSENRDMSIFFLFGKIKSSLQRRNLSLYIYKKRYENAISVWKTIKIQYKSLILGYKKVMQNVIVLTSQWFV